jgi:hypothetical protein
VPYLHNEDELSCDTLREFAADCLQRGNSDRVAQNISYAFSSCPMPLLRIVLAYLGCAVKQSPVQSVFVLDCSAVRRRRHFAANNDEEPKPKPILARLGGAVQKNFLGLMRNAHRVALRVVVCISSAAQFPWMSQQHRMRPGPVDTFLLGRPALSDQAKNEFFWPVNRYRAIADLLDLTTSEFGQRWSRMVNNVDWKTGAQLPRDKDPHPRYLGIVLAAANPQASKGAEKDGEDDAKASAYWCWVTRAPSVARFARQEQ